MITLCNMYRMEGVQNLQMTPSYYQCLRENQRGDFDTAEHTFLQNASLQPPRALVVTYYMVHYPPICVELLHTKENTSHNNDNKHPSPPIAIPERASRFGKFGVGLIY